MAQATLSIRIDADLKSNLEAVCSELGINITTAITMLAKKMVREQRIPFDVSIEYVPSKERIREGIKKRNAEKCINTSDIEK